MTPDRPLLFFGELLWDLLPQGPQPGGAPANVAVNAHHCGANALLASAVGEDEAGKRILTLLDARKLRLDGIQRLADKPTGSVRVSLGAKDAPEYHIAKNVAWDAIAATDALLAAAAQARVFYFGSLAQRSALSRQTLNQLLSRAPADCLRFFDINLRQPFPQLETLKHSLAHTDVLKLNDEELPLLTQWLGLPAAAPEFAQNLCTTTAVRAVVLTQGSKGALLFENGGNKAGIHIAATPVRKLVNTVGAGDAFSAGFLAAAAGGADLPEAARAGSALASRACESEGAWL